jgi:hypothetical protein
VAAVRAAHQVTHPHPLQVRFRSTSDGQWYAGRVTDLAGDMAAVVYYAPTNSQVSPDSPDRGRKFADNAMQACLANNACGIARLH